jgi:hypothetical protein
MAENNTEEFGQESSKKQKKTQRFREKGFREQWRGMRVAWTKAVCGSDPRKKIVHDG